MTGPEQLFQTNSDLSFDEFFEREQQDAVRLAWLLVRDPGLAEDIVQEAFTAVFLRFGSIDQPRPYLRRAILNGVRAHARSGGRRERRERLSVAGAATSTPPPGDPILDMVAELPERQRAVIVLRYWADLPDDEIADVLGCRRSSVRSLAHRAVRDLERKLPS